mgnify:CR=1 FL=1
MNDNETSDLDSLWHARSEAQREAHARAEHLRVLSRHAIFALLGNLVGSLTLVIGLWASVRPGLLITWFSVMMMFSFARWMTGRRFPGGVISEAETRRWEMRLIASVAISGFLWGAAGGLFYVPGQPEQGLFVALILVGMCAAATASLSYHRFAYPVFLLPAITPVALHLMLDDKLALNAIGFVIPFYFTLLYLLSRAIYRTAHESILSRINSQYQAMFDHLTGVANRRAFEQTMDREWFRAKRDKRALSLVIADIDNFKLCNDTRGHAVGDLLLKAIAALLERRIRRGADLVARIGGEEFAILLPDTDLNGAMALAQSIKVGLSELAESYNNQIPQVTMSYGVSSLVPDSSVDSDILFQHADEALYLAKGKGKDRVESIDTA